MNTATEILETAHSHFKEIVKITGSRETAIDLIHNQCGLNKSWLTKFYYGFAKNPTKNKIDDLVESLSAVMNNIQEKAIGTGVPANDREAI